jgi:hypothetical protein
VSRLIWFDFKLAKRSLCFFAVSQGVEQDKLALIM